MTVTSATSIAMRMGVMATFYDARRVHHALHRSRVCMERSSSDASPLFGRDGPRQPVLSKSDGVLFAPCLDNARRCFLILKYIFFPLSVLLGTISALLKVLLLFGKVQHFTSISVFFFINCVTAAIIGAPVLLIPAIVRQRRVPACLRLAVANCLFVSVCLLVPVLTAHCVWRRQYREVNGFLLLHECMPAAPPRARLSVVPTHEALSVCDDEFFLYSLYFRPRFYVHLSLFPAHDNRTAPAVFYVHVLCAHVAPVVIGCPHQQCVRAVVLKSPICRPWS